MYVLVNEQRIDIKSYKVKRINTDGHLLLTVFIAKETKTGNELDELCDYIELATPKLFVYDDASEKVETLTGFRLKARFGRNEDGTAWKLEIENSSELEYQYGLLLDRAEALENQNKEQAATIQTQAATISSLNQQLLVLQLAAADLYEKNLKVDATETPVEETTEGEDADQTETEQEVQ